MSFNLDNALRGIQDARTAIMLETGSSPKDMADLIDCELQLNEVEQKLKEMNDG